MLNGRPWQHIVKIDICTETTWIKYSTSSAIYPAEKNMMVKPWFTIVVRMCTVELAFTFGVILRVTVQHLGIDMWKTMGSQCLKNMSIKGKVNFVNFPLPPSDYTWKLLSTISGLSENSTE
jgi:hypothetical protein